MANPVTYGTSGVTYGTAGINYGQGTNPVYPFSERWSIDGVPLQTYAYNISTWGGSRQSPPPLRGANVTIPHRSGQRFLPKEVDSRTITLGMWVVGANPDGSIADRVQFEKNWRMLRKLLWTPRREITISKMFLNDSGVMSYASAKAQFAGGLEPEMNGRTRAAFAVDLLLADPFFYGTKQSYTLTLPGTPTVTVPALGDVETDHLRATFTGPLVNPRLMNTITTGQVWFQFNGSLDTSADTLLVDIRKFQATKNLTIKSVGAITHSGDYSWMKFSHLGNQVQLSAASGTGNCVIDYFPAWL